MPSLSAPRDINFSASAIELMPPAAFILTFLPTYLAKSSISSKVAPPVEKPVLVFIKSAPLLVTI